MSKKVDYFLSLNALLGVHGVRTSLLQSNQDYWTCAKALWPNLSERDSSLESLQRQIKAMSKNQRRSLAKSNLHRIPARFYSEAPVHEKALAAALAKETAA